jgi:hypothetical protein
MNKFVVATLFCIFPSYLLNFDIVILPPRQSAMGEFAKGLGRGLESLADQGIRARERQQEHENHMAEIRAQEEMIERQRRWEEANRQYQAELEARLQVEQILANTDKATVHE